MDKIEKLIEQYLKGSLSKNEKTPFCLTEQVLIDYVRQDLNEKERAEAEKHIADCGFCLSQLDIIYRALKTNEWKKEGKAPVKMIQKAKALLKSDSSPNKKKVNKRLGKTISLIVVIISFVLSFFIPKYFMQLLVVTLIFGIRWAFESEGGRTLIMVLDSWRRHSHYDDDEIAKRLKDRSRSFHR